MIRTDPIKFQIDQCPFCPELTVLIKVCISSSWHITFIGLGGGAAQGGGAEEGFSFEDSDRFDEDSVCFEDSLMSEPESICTNWRGWRKQNLNNIPHGHYQHGQ